MGTESKRSERVERARRGVFVVLAEAGIKSRDDRLELAEDVLGKRVESFSKLDDDDYLDLHFALQSWKRIQDIRSANNSILEEAVVIVENLYDIDLSQHVRVNVEPLPYQGEED